MSAILSKAAGIGDGNEGLSVRRRVKNGEIPELQANKDSKEPQPVGRSGGMVAGTG